MKISHSVHLEMEIEHRRMDEMMLMMLTRNCGFNAADVFAISLE